MSEGRLKLLAHTQADVDIVSAALQDAVAPPQKVVFDGRSRRLVLQLNRFMWERAQRSKGYRRIRTILSVDSVQAVRAKAMTPAIRQPLNLLRLAFEPSASGTTQGADGENLPTGYAPGVFRLVFSGGAELGIEVECVDVLMSDTGEPWPTRRRPEHGKAK